MDQSSSGQTYQMERYEYSGRLSWHRTLAAYRDLRRPQPVTTSRRKADEQKPFLGNRITKRTAQRTHLHDNDTTMPTMQCCGPMSGMGGSAGFTKVAPSEDGCVLSDNAKFATAAIGGTLFLSALSSATPDYPYEYTRVEQVFEQIFDEQLPAASAPVTVLLASVLALAVAALALRQRQRRAAATAKGSAKLLALEAYRVEQVQQMRRDRLVRERAAAAVKMELLRRRDAAVTLQRGYAAKLQRARAVRLAAPCAAARTQLQHKYAPSSEKHTWRSALHDLPSRYMPSAADARVRPTLRLHEVAVVGESAEGQALLDTGNAGHTLITRSFAERADLIDPSGLPCMLTGSAVRYVTVRGVVPGAEEECVVVPSVSISIGGLELRSDIAVTENETLGCALLVSITDIDCLVEMGAVFQPTRHEIVPVQAAPACGFELRGEELGAGETETNHCPRNKAS